MVSIRDIVSSNYRRCLRQPVMMLVVVSGVTMLASYHAQRVVFDASADTLVAENDPAVAFYREVRERFGNEEFLVMTYAPDDGGVLTRENLARLDALVRRLESVDGVASVYSILDAPLLKSPPIPLGELAGGFNTLRSPNVDFVMARSELTQSPLFRNLLISTDGKTSAITIDMDPDTDLDRLRELRDELRLLEHPSAEDDALLSEIETKYGEVRANYVVKRSRLVDDVRALRDRTSGATLHLGGVPMIAADMIAFVRSDIVVFGSSVLVAITLMLYLFFRRLRWVVIPLGTCAVTLVLTLGWLGFIEQPITVISSNFMSLLAIITISFSVHLIVRYRELLAASPDANHTDMVYDTMRSIFAPCLYTAVTTVAAFGSLMSSDIVPVQDFGSVICIGVVISFVTTYGFFAAVLLLLPKGEPGKTISYLPRFIETLSKLSSEHTNLILFSAVVSFVIAGVGVTLISLDNRFIDYFDEDTEINRGMVYIDQHLGGTMPFDVIVRFKPFESSPLDPEDDFFAAEEDPYPERYWFTPAKLEILSDLHAYIESRDRVGKVMSLSNLEAMARDFNDGRPLDALQLVVALSAMPESVRTQMVDRFASPSTGELRISVRVIESGPAFPREELINDIRAYAEQLGFASDDIEFTGMMVLFNDMLSKLFESQTSTLVYVLISILIVFALVLRSVTFAVVGLIPNVLAALTILGCMGFLGIPLDMMTITIAAIIIGIGVDDAIHYMHRFRRELEARHDAIEAVRHSHASIGRALYFTSLTVVVGFSVLSLSNFVPTVHFGLLTALAMILALLANMTILPALLIRVFRASQSRSDLRAAL